MTTMGKCAQIVRCRVANPVNRRFFAIVVSYAVAFSCGLTQAQQATSDTPPPGEKTVLEPVAVTGTRIRNPDAESANPITVITAEDIKASSAASLEDVLRWLPSAGANGSNGGSAPGQQTGVYSIDLRNLGPDRTLVLLNGRRFVPTVSVAGVFVDLNNFPLSFIDHIDILRDGASPVYGSDAVAGVINIVTRKNIQGLTLDVNGGISGHGDRDTGGVSATYGKNIGNGNVSFNFEYSQQGRVSESSRPFAVGNVNYFNVNPNGSVTNVIGAPITYGGVTLVNGNPTTVILGPGQTAPYTAADNTARNGDLFSPDKRATANTIGHFDLGDNLEFFFEGGVSHHELDAIGSYPLGIFSYPNFPNGLLIPANNPYNFFGAPVTLYRWLGELGNVTYDNKGDAARFLTGLRGRLLDRYDWEVAYNFGTSHITTAYLGVNYPNVANAVDPTLCASAPGCVVADFFGPGSLTQAAGRYITDKISIDRAYQQNDLTETLNGDLFRLPAGAASFALGGEQRFETYSVSPNAFAASGNEGTPTLPESGEEWVKEFYAEALFPLVNQKPLVQKLNLDLAGRWSDYGLSGVGSTWKAGLDWSPNSWVRLRANKSTAFRAPALDELYAAPSTFGYAAVDPCDSTRGQRSNPAINAACTAQGAGPGFTQLGSTISGFISGNPGLKPETANNSNIGLVFTPAHGLTATVDYFNIKLSGAIGQPDYNYVLTQCYSSGASLSSPYCAGLTRYTSGAIAGQLEPLQLRNENLGAINTSGLDYSLDYRVPARIYDGIVNLKLVGQYLAQYTVQQQPGGSFTPYQGTDGPENSTFGSYPRNKVNGTVTYSTGNYSAGYTLRMIGKMTDFYATPASPYNNIPAVYYSNIFGDVKINKKLLLRLGVDNLFDKQPPFILNGDNYDMLTYDVIGRYFWTRLSYSFN